jgi:hypothetical protein
MDTLNKKIKFLLSLILLLTATYSQALPIETEYQGIVARSGYYDDGAWGAFPIGFDFDFFGSTYSDFYVTSNGLVMFGGGSTQYTNHNIPNTWGADNYIAPFWDDIVIHSSGDIMYQTIGTAPNRKLVIQFTNMSFWNSPVLLGTFQVILYEGSNNIQTQYRSIVDLTSDRASGNSATIGLENADGSAGVLYSYNTTGVVQSEKAILFTPGGGTYTYDDNAVYEGVLLQDVVPRASTPNLVSPAYGSTVGRDVSFQWDAAANASSYFVVISQNSDLSSPIHTSADLTDLSYDFTLADDQTYFWSAYSKNSVDAISWSEIWTFQTSSAPPLVAVPQAAYVEQGNQRELTLVFTGGDAGSKTASVTSLPAEGSLYQNNGGIPGPQITTVPTDVTDGSFKLIYSADGASGNGAGNFDFEFTDATWTSTDETYTINVSPPGIPNFLYASKETDRVEITFDREMSDPTGKHLEFSIQDDGVDVTSVSCNLKSGDPATIVVYVSPNLDTDNAISVAYTKGTVTAASTGVLESFDFQLAGKLAQVINFSALADKTYGDPDYALTATASSGLGITFTSSNSTVVSVSGSTATVNNAGESLIYASQAGDATYASVSFEQHQLVNKATATVTLSDLSQEYTGSKIGVSASTVPAGLTLKVTYDGSVNQPTDPGSYAVSADVEETNYSGNATGTLVITDLTPPVPDVDPLPDLSGECSVTPTAPTATDLYVGSITGSTPTPFPITDQGSTMITWSFDDGYGNITTQTQNVLINDVTDPDTPVLDDVTGECSATATVPTTKDACAGTITGTTSDPLTYNTQGTHVITWTFDDGNGNSITVPQNVIIDDVTDPDTPVLEDVTGECSATATVPTTTDACAGTINGTTTDPLTYSTQGTHVITWTFDDGNGNSIVVPQNVVINDVTSPDTPVIADLTGECTATAVAPTTADACAGIITGTTTDPLTYNTQGTYIITWTFDDGNGNSVTATQNVVIADVTPPVATIPPDVTGECSATASAPTANDACAGIITGTTTDPLTYTTQGTHVITWTFDDGNGNSVTATQNVIVDDVTDPLPPVLNDVTGECSATAVAPTTTDACAGILTGTTSDPLTYSTQGTHVITWTFDDGNGNSIDVTQNVVILDVTPPLTPILADVTGECAATATAPTTTDACAGTITGTTTDPLTYSSQGTHVITWTFDDGNGNSVIAAQNVVITDLTPPDVPVLPDVTGECSATAVAPTTTDACAGTITGITSDPLTYTTQGTHVITWTFDDGNGNSSTATQNVVVNDVTPPLAPALADVVGECSATASVPSTTDACEGSITGSTTDPLSYSTQGTHVITWNFDDGNGNVTTVTQNVIVEDVSDPDIPVLPDINGECSVEVTAPSTNDACAGIITATTSDPLSYTSSGTHVITWTFDDGNGNSIDVTQNVIITDLTAPDTPVLPDLSGECSVTALAPTTTDACAGLITGTTSDPLSYDIQGSYVINWNFDDGNGNSIDVAQNVLVADLTAPTASCPADVVTCDGTVTSIGLSDVLDNCSTPVVTYELSGATSGSGSGDASVVSFNPGLTTLTYTFTDEAGNSNQCMFTVTYETVDEIVVTQTDATLQVETTGSYQWINCLDNSILVGQTSDTFTPEESGDYAVIVTQQGSCSDTSDCYTVDYTALDLHGLSQHVDVYPNPAHNFLNMELEHENTNVTLKVMNAMGQVVLVEELEKLDKTRLDVSKLHPGVYLISIHSDQMDKILRIVKE